MKIIKWSIFHAIPFLLCNWDRKVWVIRCCRMHLNRVYTIYNSAAFVDISTGSKMDLFKFEDSMVRSQGIEIFNSLKAKKTCIWKCRLFMSFAQYSCKLFKPILCIQTNSVDPDQTAPLGAVWTGTTLFAKMTFKITSRWQFLWLTV